MEKLKIYGGKPLKGEVSICGAKNAAICILPAILLIDGCCRIENLPDIIDVKRYIMLLEELGLNISQPSPNEVIVENKGIRTTKCSLELCSKMRASYYLVGALLGRYKSAEVPLPGGCNFGSRPIDQHIKGFEALGATVDIVNGGMVRAKADNLVGNHVYMDVVTVGATINIMLAAVLAEGKTTIENAAKEPHIVDVANFLNSMGANIKGAGTDVIRIRGVQRLKGTEYSIIPDQIEAGTFMTMAAATKGNVLIKNVIPKHLEAISSKLNEIGAKVIEYDDSVRVMADGRLKSTQIKTLPYPGFPTDMQPQMAVTLALSKGTSIITESIFENRFKYVGELSRMGARIKVEGNSAIINGIDGYTGANLVAPDLRAGAALVMAALAAEGFSTVEDIKYILRGYEDFDGKIRSLGGQISVVDSDKEVQKFKLRVG